MYLTIDSLIDLHNRNDVAQEMIELLLAHDEDFNAHKDQWHEWGQYNPDIKEVLDRYTDAAMSDQESVPCIGDSA